jgi:flagellar hook-basal body protein
MTEKGLIKFQGLIQESYEKLHLAISGNGCFVVENKDTHKIHLSRRGDFEHDSQGQLVNSDNDMLLGWKLDDLGRKPGELGNLDQRDTNYVEALDPIKLKDIPMLYKAATTNVVLGINLDAREEVLHGAGETINFGANSPTNIGIAYDDVIIPTEQKTYCSTTKSRQLISKQGLIQSLHENSDLTISETGFFVVKSKPDDNDTYYTRAGTFKRNEAGTFVNAAGDSLIDSLMGKKATFSTLISSSNPINAKSLSIGDAITLTPSNPGNTYTYTYGGFVESNDISINILGASNAIGQFTEAAEGDNFAITCNGTTLTFTYTTSTPDAEKGEFNTLYNLAMAIKEAAGTNLTARVYGNNLYISPRDASLAMTFADKQGTFVKDLGLENTDSAANRFATLEGLNELINSTTSLGVSSFIESPTSSATLTFYADNPLGSLKIGAVPASNSASSSTENILSQFGLSTDIAEFGPTYDPSDVSKSMASGKVTYNMSMNITVYDDLGIDHNLEMSFVKVNTNTWAVELYSSDPRHLAEGARIDGLVASGVVEFNGDGTLKAISSSLADTVTIDWANGASTSNIKFNLGNAGDMPGTIGATSIGDCSGLRQFGADYDIPFFDQNGRSPGLFITTETDQNGYLIADYSNGDSKEIYQIPLVQGKGAAICAAYPDIDKDDYDLYLHEAGKFIMGEIHQSSIESIDCDGGYPSSYCAV